MRIVASSWTAALPLALVAFCLPPPTIAHAQAVADVTLPGDAIRSSSTNSPANEGVANAIDNNTSTKFLNFDAGSQNGNQAISVTVAPGTGLTVVNGLAITSANDAPERDPASYTVFGSLDGSTFTQIATGTLPSFTNRLQEQTVSFANSTAYWLYRLTINSVATPSAANSLQFSEMRLPGLINSITGATVDLTDAGANITATRLDGSPLNPASPTTEGIANLIDNSTSSKFLSFNKTDTLITIAPNSGSSLLKGLWFTSANDAPERDPTSFLILGSNDGVNYTQIATSSIPSFGARAESQAVYFANSTYYTSYRLSFPTLSNDSTANSLQLAEIRLAGFAAPPVVVPEAATLPLAASGLLPLTGLIIARRRRHA